MLLGTLLNPLNSSMIAVALVPLHADFRVSLGAVSWLVSGFYLAAAVGQPLLGRLADQFGARRVFCSGLVLVGLTGTLAPLSPSFAALVGFRVVQAFGTSAAFPAGLALIRREVGGPSNRPPAYALGWLSVASAVSAALGPTLGGLLVSAASWRSIFLVNLPITALGLVLALRWLPGGRGQAQATRAAGAREALRRADLPGIVLFSATLAGLLAFLLTLSQGPLWYLLPLPPVAAGLLLWRERRVREPFLDVRMLAANRSLLSVYAQYAGINLVFYTIFFAMPIWLEQARGFPPEQAGLLLLPISGLGVVATALAARLIDRSGPRPALVIGAAALGAGSLLLLLFGPTTPALVILAVGAVLGVPNAFNNLGLQAALYQAAPPEATATAGGQFQTFRYVGAILSTSLLGLVFGASVTSSGLHQIAVVLAAVSAALVAASVALRR